MKQKIRLTESELNQLVESAVYMALQEKLGMDTLRNFGRKAKNAGKEALKTAAIAGGVSAAALGGLAAHDEIYGYNPEPEPQQYDPIVHNERLANDSIARREAETGEQLDADQTDKIYRHFHRNDGNYDDLPESRVNRLAQIVENKVRQKINNLYRNA